MEENKKLARTRPVNFSFGKLSGTWRQEKIPPASYTPPPDELFAVGVRSREHGEIETFGDVVRTDPYLAFELGNAHMGAFRRDISFHIGVYGDIVVRADFSAPFWVLGAETAQETRKLCDTLLVGVMKRASPAQMRVLLLSTTGGFSRYEGLPHLIMPPASEREGVLRDLRWAVREMDRRYSLFRGNWRGETKWNEDVPITAPVWNIEEYNENHATDGKALPYLFIVLDDLPCCSKEGIETLTRLSQKARAAGILIALGLSAVGIMGIPEELLSNFMGRLVLPVGEAQWEKLLPEEEWELASGEALIKIGGRDAVRFTCIPVPEGERDSAIHFLADRMSPQYVEIDQTTRSSDDEVPEKWLRALRFVVETGEAYIDPIHEACGAGYAESGRILDWMEWNGFIGPFKDMHRDIYLTKEHLIELFGDE